MPIGYMFSLSPVIYQRFPRNPIMSLSSKPKKVKLKGTVRELKLVQTISRHGTDTIKAEEVKTPQHGSRKATSTSHHKDSSSPTKRLKMGTFFDSEPIPCNLEGPDMSKKRQTLVFILLLHQQQSLTTFRAKTTSWDSSWTMRKHI
jgi:hypothetical protein